MAEVGLIVIIVSHLAALTLTISRLVNRIWRNTFSLDDAFATVTGLGTSLIVGVLVEIGEFYLYCFNFAMRLMLLLVLKVPAPMTLGHRLIIGGCCFVIWYVNSQIRPGMWSDTTNRTSKAQSVMTLGRVLYASYWPQREPLFFFLSLMLFLIGAAHFGIALFICKSDENCPDNTPCYCGVAPELVLSALISK